VAAWESLPSRVDVGIDLLLATLADGHHRGTFFIVGWLAERRPAMVRRILAAGHEIASHGYMHRRVDALGPNGFRADLRRSKEVLEQVAGVAIHGFRAPSFSITPQTPWAFDILVEEGFAYDSSVFPARKPTFGIPASAVEPYNVVGTSGTIREFPLTTLRWLGARWPAAGGNYWRQLPALLVEQGVAQHDRDGLAAMIYVHPWELDPAQPRFDVPSIVKLRHYGGLARMEGRIRRLLSQHRFGSIRDVHFAAQAA
jgi:polysaccharide deacetylase family protein (PEP-CTERM system associated)